MLRPTPVPSKEPTSQPSQTPSVTSRPTRFVHRLTHRQKRAYKYHSTMRQERRQTVWLKTYIAFSWLFLAVALVLIIRRYASRNLFKWYNYVACFIMYGAGLGIIIAIPIDVAFSVKARLAIKEEVLHQYEKDHHALVRPRAGR